jgi:hypothetical protein
MILQTLFPIRVDIICGDIIINYLNDSDRMSQLKAPLNSYNLFSTVTFPTRIGEDCISAIDNILLIALNLKMTEYFLQLMAFQIMMYNL